MKFYVQLLTALQAGKERGAGMAEYALLVALIALVVALAIPGFATAVSGVFTAAGTAMGN